jgi:hypothetical protein
MINPNALQTVLQAAEKWRDELGQEIIPGADSEEDAKGYQEEHDAIDAAIEELRPKPAEHLPEPTAEFKEKRGELAEFLYELYHGPNTWIDVLAAPLDDDRYSNYMADADDILRANPHLLTLETNEQMGIDH